MGSTRRSVIGITMRLVIFSNVGLRPDSTSIYFINAFRQVLSSNNVWHIQSQEELNKLTGTEADYYLKIDDGQEWQRWENHKLQPSGYYVIDTHIDLEWRQKLVKEANFRDLFFAQRKALNETWNAPNRLWVPLGCDLQYHNVGRRIKKHDVCFMGNFHTKYADTRLDFVDTIFKTVDKPFFSNMRTFHKYTEAMAESKLVFNKALNGDVNMRFFEGLCSGSALLSDVLPDQEELGFKSMEHYIGYQSKDDMIDKIKYFLKHDDERENIANKGHALVSSEHTYTDRVLQILKEIQRNKTCLTTH